MIFILFNCVTPSARGKMRHRGGPVNTRREKL
jgi:hypothetical protein